MEQAYMLPNVKCQYHACWCADNFRVSAGMVLAPKAGIFCPQHQMRYCDILQTYQHFKWKASNSIHIFPIEVVVILFPTEYKHWRTEYMSNIITTTKP